MWQLFSSVLCVAVVFGADYSEITGTYRYAGVPAAETVWSLLREQKGSVRIQGDLPKQEQPLSQCRPGEVCAMHCGCLRLVLGVLDKFLVWDVTLLLKSCRSWRRRLDRRIGPAPTTLSITSSLVRTATAELDRFWGDDRERGESVYFLYKVAFHLITTLRSLSISTPGLSPHGFPSMRNDFPSMENPLSLKSITNVFKIDSKSTLMDSHRWKIDSHRPPCHSHGFPSM